MSIELTNKQYKALLQLVTAGNYMFNRYQDPDKREVEHQEVCDLVLKAAKRAECYEYYTQDEDGAIKPTMELADDVGGLIGNYNYTLFENLVERDGLAEKLPALHFVDTDDENGWFDGYVSTYGGE